MNRVVTLLILCSAASAQTIIYRAVVYDAVVSWPFTTYTKIYVVFPPEADVSPAKNNTNFRNNVMTQDVIDGSDRSRTLESGRDDGPNHKPLLSQHRHMPGGYGSSNLLSHI